MELQKLQKLKDWCSCAHVLQHHGRPSCLETSCLGANMLQRSCFLRSKIRCSLSAMVLSRSLISFSLESLSWSSQENIPWSLCQVYFPPKKKLFARIYCTSGRIAMALNGFKKKQKPSSSPECVLLLFGYRWLSAWLLLPSPTCLSASDPGPERSCGKKFPMAPWTIRVSFHRPRGARPVRIAGIQRQLNTKNQLL